MTYWQEWGAGAEYHKAWSVVVSWNGVRAVGSRLRGNDGWGVGCWA